MQLQLYLVLLFLLLCCMIVALPNPPSLPQLDAGEMTNATRAQLGLELRDVDLTGKSLTHSVHSDSN